MSKTKTVTSKPLPRLPMAKRKSSASTIMSSCASTPSKFYISEQDSFANKTESPARLAPGILRLDNNPGSFGAHPSATQQQRQHDRPSRSLRVPTSTCTAQFWTGGTEEKDDMLPHLISQNTVTYHSNFFERPHLGEESRSSDPLEIEELQVELRSPAAGDPALAFGGNAEKAPATSTPAAAHRVLSLKDLDSATSSDFYQHRQYRQQHSQPSVLPPPLPSHRNRSQRNYGAPSGHARGGVSVSRKPVGLDQFNVEGSWAFDAAGKAYFRGTGKIEEVQQGEDDEQTMQEDQVILKSSAGSSELGSQNRLMTFEETSPLPPTTTPPPRPRRVEQAVLSPGGTNFSIPKTIFNSTPGLSDIGITGANGNLCERERIFSHACRRRVGLDVQLGLPVDLDDPFARLDILSAPLPTLLPAPLPAPPPEPVIKPELEDLDLETQSLLQMLKHVDDGVKDIAALRDVRHHFTL